ncbi:hypothetical protein HKX48_006070 [Thoreauomyces humboldtii]|nr:hypothetical protein HKX48_006070 [Thoreauomyces humboldtii]
MAGATKRPTAASASRDTTTKKPTIPSVVRTDPTGQYIYDTHLIVPTTARDAFPPLGYALSIVLAVAWYLFLPLDAKLRTIVAAVTFSGIEYTFYSVSIETVAGDILIRPFDPRCRKGHTTWQQFCVNIIFTPLILDIYMNLVPTWWLRVALYPINIWLLEIVEGYFLTYLYGYNPAWSYRGNDALFDGNIKLSYAPFWWSLGAVVEVIFPTIKGYTRVVAGLLKGA